ncbi:hypothetical protein FB45DRAFT_910733 [Roridomyces roridus]|uniref:Uncharacterized protein n=1 Tax=Roridomyces roridus TaxID=1738132 RepID=A0AAD7BZS2_9AGAR|nr:hypothetical protein FB45DRAFT_910733 [Roridomyces roridus]
MIYSASNIRVCTLIFVHFRQHIQAFSIFLIFVTLRILLVTLRILLVTISILLVTISLRHVHIRALVANFNTTPIRTFQVRVFGKIRVVSILKGLSSNLHSSNRVKSGTSRLI